MIHTLEVLDRSGHLTLNWDPEDPTEVAKAKQQVEQLRVAGYSFFAVLGEGKEIDESAGTLLIERIEAVAITEPETEAKPTKKKPTQKGKRTVAMKPQRGG